MVLWSHVEWFWSAGFGAPITMVQIDVKSPESAEPKLVYNMSGWWLSPTPLKNMSSSAGIMKFPTEWKVIKFHGSKPPTRCYKLVHYGEKRWISFSEVLVD